VFTYLPFVENAMFTKYKQSTYGDVIYSVVQYVRKMPKIKSSCQNWFYCFFGFLRCQICV